MAKRWVTMSYRVGMGLLVFAAIGVQFAKALDRTDFSPVNFFSFFTILSNIFAATIFLYGASRIASQKQPTPLFDLLRGASVVYMTVTAIVFALLLSHLQEDLQLTLPWVDPVLHQLMPAAVFVDWLLNPPRAKLSLRRASLWVCYPLAYLAYSLVRGAIVDWYPYPFLDPGTNGHAAIFLHSVAIMLGMIALIWVTVMIGNLLRARRPQRA